VLDWGDGAGHAAAVSPAAAAQLSLLPAPGPAFLAAVHGRVVVAGQLLRMLRSMREKIGATGAAVFAQQRL
jgi:hypothetical protein